MFTKCVAVLVTTAVFATGTVAGARANSLAVFEQSGADVTATFSGTLNLPGSVASAPVIMYNGVAPTGASIATGVATEDSDIYNLLSAPDNFGTGGFVAPTSSTVNWVFEILGGSGEFVIQLSTMTDALSGVMTFAGTTLSGLGLDLGTYTYEFSNHETFTVQIGAVPVPAGLPLALTGLGALGFLGWRQRRKPAAVKAAS